MNVGQLFYSVSPLLSITRLIKSYDPVFYPSRITSNVIQYYYQRGTVLLAT